MTTIVADIGGTNTRVALCDTPEAANVSSSRSACDCRPVK